jgi:hypothetical protein
VVGLALVQVGVLLRDQLVLTQAARVGAREASVSPSDDEVRSAVASAAAGLDPSVLETIVERTGEQGAPVKVSLSYPSPIRVPLVAWLVPENLVLRATATFRQEFV